MSASIDDFAAFDDQNQAAESLFGGWLPETLTSVATADAIPAQRQWSPQPSDQAAPVRGVRVDDPAQPESEEPSQGIWRAHYPEDDAQTGRQLAADARRLQLSGAVVAAAPRRLDAYLSLAAASDALPSSAALPGYPRPEAEMTDLLIDTVNRARGIFTERSASIASALSNAMRTLRALAGHLREVGRKLTVVETQVGDDMIGVGRLTWSGNIETWLASGVSRRHVRLHQRTFALAMETRQMVIRLGMLIVAGTSKLLALLAVPGGFLRAAPLIVRFVDQIRSEYTQATSTGISLRN